MSPLQIKTDQHIKVSYENSMVYILSNRYLNFPNHGTFFNTWHELQCCHSAAKSLFKDLQLTPFTA